MNKRESRTQYHKNHKQGTHISILVIMAVFICSIALSAAMKATAADSHSRYKYYKSIEIQSGDTLWSIADTYISEEYDSVDSYIAEVKAMNSLASNDITSGHYLVIPYYDWEKK